MGPPRCALTTHDSRMLTRHPTFEAMRLTLRCVVALGCAPLVRGTCQQVSNLTRAQAIAAAVAHGPRLAVSVADTMLAAGQLISARAFPNPALSASYSKSLPNYHVTAELPFDFIALRSTRIRSANAARVAAQYRFAFDRASVELDADTTYTRTLAAAAHVRLSQRNAVAADSVRRIAIARRDAGDASELDVQLATVTAGQAANGAAADSLALAATLLDLQSLLGMPADRITIAPSDSLLAPLRNNAAVTSEEMTLPVASATASVESAALAAKLQHRSVFLLPGLMFGFEAGDPTGAEPGILPTFGIILPLPFFNQNRGPIAEAEAARQRATAALEFTRIESRTRIAQAQRTEVGAQARIVRDALLVTSANRVADMSLTAYREGAVPLATALEAQRSARDILAQYIDDVATASIAAATLRVLTLTPRSVTTP
jgi:cobalt-zinc-cadmium efflux system outer membrane protein